MLCDIRLRNDRTSRPKMLQFDLGPHRDGFIHTSRIPVSTERGERTLKSIDPRVWLFKHFILVVLKMKYTIKFAYVTLLVCPARRFVANSIELHSRTSTASKFTFWIIFSTEHHNSVQFHLPQHIMSINETDGQGVISSTRHSAVRLLRPIESENLSTDSLNQAVSKLHGYSAMIDVHRHSIHMRTSNID